MHHNNIGIVAEFNPFHNGHAYFLREAKRLSDADNLIVVMSASFTQRGEVAICDKFTRARWAIQNGADMVIELPDVFALSSAEFFSGAAVKLLYGTGIVDGICFGSESGSIDPLLAAAESNIDRKTLQALLKSGLSYPAAMYGASSEKVPSQPNDILAVEYLRAVSAFAPRFKAYTVKRIGSNYSDTELNGAYSSATAVRKLLHAGKAVNACTALPKSVANDIMNSEKKLSFADTELLSNICLYALRTLGPDGIRKITDVSEGLENLLYRSALDSQSFSELIFNVKSRRYTLARIKRIVLSSVLGITRELRNEFFTSPDALFVRVLGINGSKIELLSELCRNASLPVLMRHSDIRKLSSRAKRLFELTSMASSVRALADPADKTAKDEFANALIMV